MSEVKRWYFGSFSGQILALNKTDDQEIGEEEDVDFVLASDYDAAQAELAALREELKWWQAGSKAEADAGDEARKALTAAEQRNVQLEGALERIKFRMDSFISAGRDVPFDSAQVTSDIAGRHLNPPNREQANEIQVRPSLRETSRVSWPQIYSK